MQPRSATTPPFPSDVPQFLKLYAENVGKWQQNYEKILRTQLNQLGMASAPASTSSLGANPFMQSAQEFTKQMVDNQIEIWNFLVKRLEKDQAFQTSLAKCKTPDDLVHLYTDFYSKMFNDYAEEMKKLTEPTLRIWAESAEAMGKPGNFPR